MCLFKFVDTRFGSKSCQTNEKKSHTEIIPLFRIFRHHFDRKVCNNDEGGGNDGKLSGYKAEGSRLLFSATDLMASPAKILKMVGAAE